MNYKKGDTVYIDADNRKNVLCEIVKEVPINRSNGFSFETGTVFETVVKYDCLVISNKAFQLGAMRYKKNELKGMIYSFVPSCWGMYTLMPCTEFIFNQKSFEICLNENGKPCQEGDDPKEVIFIKAEKVFSVENRDYFVYKYVYSSFEGRNQYAYGIAEYMTGISYVTGQSKGRINNYIYTPFESTEKSELIAA